MNRMDRIAPLIDALPDDVFEEFVAAAKHAASDETIYANLAPTERTRIDSAIARLDAGEGVGYEVVKARMAAKLKARSE